MSNKTWELVDVPKGSKPISSKWIFKQKLRSNGSIDKYKARLVIRGFDHKKGIDYFDTDPPIPRLRPLGLQFPWRLM